VEFAYFYNAFGTQVTLVEMLPQILPVEDEEVAKTLHRALEKQGIAIRTATKCENFRVGKDSVKLNLVKDGQSDEIEVETGEVLGGGRGDGRDAVDVIVRRVVVDVELVVPDVVAAVARKREVRISDAGRNPD